MKHRIIPGTKRLLPLFIASSIAVTSASANDELTALREQLAQLQEAVKRLEQQQAETPKISAGPKGFSVESPDKAYSFSVSGLVQLDSRFYLSNNSPGTDTFELRRVRPTLKGTLGKNLSFRITPELASNVRILDAYADFTAIENNVIRFGNFKAPVGLERLQGGGNLLFNERGFATEFTPGRDLGIQLQSTFLEKRLITKIGVFNGEVDGSNGAPNLGTGGFNLSGSIFVEPFRNNSDSVLKGLGFGFAGSYGRRNGNAGFRLRGPNRLDVAVNGAILEDGAYYRLNPSLYYYYGPFGVLAEYILSSRELYLAGGTPTRYDNSGWTIETSYVLTGEKNSYNGVTPKNPVSLGNGGLGAWEVAIRYTGTHLDSGLFTNGLLNNQQAKKANSYGIGINWYLTQNLKAQLSYDYTSYQGGAAGFSRPDDNTILTRLQLAF